LGSSLKRSFIFRSFISVIDVFIEHTCGRTSTQEPIPPESLWQSWFQTWLTALQPELMTHPQLSQQHWDGHSPAYEVSLRLTNDAEIQLLNQQYRQIDRPTDVLAFAALEDELAFANGQYQESIAPLYLGDLVISVETAQQQALEMGHPLATELAWLTVHGFLHLLGWDHPDREQLIQMFNQQRRLLDLVGISVQQNKYLADYGEGYSAE
jgi:probable rRNA maturation factor